MVTDIKWISASEKIAQELEAERLKLETPLETTVPTFPTIATPRPMSQVTPVQIPWEEPAQAQTNLWQAPVVTRQVAQVAQPVVVQPTITQPVEQPTVPASRGGVMGVFDWIQKNLETPWATAITAPFRGGQSYEEWRKTHGFLGGVAEFSMPLWWLPYFGWASKGAGLIPKIGGTLAKGIRGTEAALALPITLPLKGVAKLVKLPAIETLRLNVFKQNRFRQIGEALSRMPGARAVVGAINPSALVRPKIASEALVQESRTLHRGLREYTTNAVNANMSQLTSKLGGNPVKNFELDELGQMTRVINPATKTKANWWDVASNLPKYKGQLNPEQIEYIKTYGNAIDDVVRYAEEMGVKIEKRDFAEGFRYIPRIWQKQVGIWDIETGIWRPLGTFAEPQKWAELLLRGAKVGGARIGGKAFFQKPRIYEYAEEALERGLRPGDYLDPNIVLETFMKGAYNEIADKVIADGLKPLGRTIKELTDRAIRVEVAQSALALRQTNRTMNLIAEMKRGFKPSTQTLKSLKGELIKNPDLVGAIKSKVPELETIIDRLAKPTIDYDTLLGQVKVLKSRLTEGYNYARAQRKIAYEAARGMPGWQAVGHPFASGRLFPEPIARELNSWMTDRGMPIFQATSDINAMMRFMVTAFDFGAMFIQGVPLLMSNPFRWGKAVGISLQSFVNPVVRARYIEKNLPVLSELIPNGLLIGNTEFMEAAAGSGLLARKSVQRADALKVIDRFSTSFNTFGDVARIEWAKALLPMARRQGATGFKELSAFLNEATGVLSSRALGIGATQRQIEASVLLFAPRYFRATMSLFADIANGGLRGTLARNTMGSMIAGFFFYYYGVCKALGQEPNLDPSSSKFGTVKIGKDHIGLGSMPLAMFRAMGNIYKTATDNPMGFLSFDSRDNPLLQFVRSRVSPISSMAWDAFTGKTYIGEPLDEPIDWGREVVLNKVLPFWVSPLFDTPRAGLSGTLGQTVGLRTWPLQFWERRDELRNELAQREYGKPWTSRNGQMGINELQKTALEEKYPELMKVTEQATAVQVARGGADEKAWLNFQTDRKRARAEYDKKLQSAQDLYNAGQISGYDFKRLAQSAGTALRGAYANIEDNPTYKSVMEFLNQPMTAEQIQNTPIEDIAFDIYMAMMYGGDLEDAAGQYNYEEADRRRDIFIAQYGQQIYQYVKDRLSSGKNIPPLMQEYYKAQDILRPYWDIQTLADKYFKYDTPSKRAFISRRRKAMLRTNPTMAYYHMLFYTQS